MFEKFWIFKFVERKVV